MHQTLLVPPRWRVLAFRMNLLFPPVHSWEMLGIAAEVPVGLCCQSAKVEGGFVLLWITPAFPGDKFAQ